MSAAKAFLDSNILVYAFQGADLRKQRIADQLVAEALAEQTSVISFQVVQETLNVLLRKLSPPMSAIDAAIYMQSTLEPLWRVQPSAALYQSAIGVQERYGFSFYDSLIIAAALSAGCSRLLSEDLQHGQRIDGLLIENPFRIEA